MNKVILLIALLLLCVTPLQAAAPAPEVVWIGGNSAGQFAYLTLDGNILELATSGAPHNIITVQWLKATPSQIAVAACGAYVYTVAIVDGATQAQRFALGEVVLPCAPAAVQIWLPLVGR